MSMWIGGLVCGLIFGIGLVISGMTQPTKVLGFLDVFGAWDPTLAFVMGGALIVAAPGFYFARRRGRPLVAARFHWPTGAEIDRPLVVGSALFGVGWGLVGLCPGPAIVNLPTMMPQIIVFVAAMGAGMVGLDLWRKRG
ncbi:MAG: DUF6691 family protein, partial [Xanthobacteraceae bacterium]